MIACRQCERQAQLFLCKTCMSELRDMLNGLARGQQLTNGRHSAGWLENLRDAAFGQTKLGSSERRTPRYRQPLDGEKPLASQIELLPGERWETVEGPARLGEQWPVQIPLEIEIDLQGARQARERIALQHALGAARINLRASELLDYAQSILVEWIRDICETRGVTVPSVDVDAMAMWLGRNVSAIASDEGAAVCFREIRQLVTDIERVINRPVPAQFLGPCPTMTNPRKRCGYRLSARREAKDVTCPQCGANHVITELVATLYVETNDYLFTLSELYSTVLPAVRQYIPLRTLQHWCARGKLQPRDYGPTGEPKYLLADVRKLRDEKPQIAATGSAAKKRRAVS